MGRIFTVYFDEDQLYCMCKTCKTHLALMDDHFQCTSNVFPEVNGAFFRKAVNVQVDGPIRHQRVGVLTVAEIYCVNCGDMLGWQCIRVDGDMNRPRRALREGNVKFITTKLLWILVRQN